MWEAPVDGIKKQKPSKNQTVQKNKSEIKMLKIKN